MKKAVVIYSGGMDSFTLVNELHSKGYELEALSFDYGQRHKKELQFAASVCCKLGVNHQIVDLSSLNGLLQGSSLTSDIDVPEGHYAEDNMKATVVPNRNMIMLSVATGYAVSLGYDSVYTAVHAGDHDIYPDCRAEFIQALSAATEIANYQEVLIVAPYLELSKGGILQSGKDNAGLSPGLYRYAWTCYKGKDKACGKCGACVERLEAFDSVGWEDPLDYDDREYWKEVLGH